MFTKNVLKSIFQEHNPTWYKSNHIYVYLGNLSLYKSSFDFIYSSKKFEEILNTFVTYNVVGHISLNKDLENDIVVNQETSKIFIITDTNNNEMYLSIGYCMPVLWYIFDNIDIKDSVSKIVETYNQNKYNNLTIFDKYYIDDDIGFNKINIILFENYYSEILIYGSKWNEFPFRNNIDIMNVNNVDKLFSLALQQNNKTCSVSTHSIFSKSLITIEKNNDHFFLNISYNPINNKNIDKMNKITGINYKNDIPIDLLLVMTKFKKLDTIQNILNKDINVNKINISIQLAYYNKEKMIEIITILKKYATVDKNLLNIIKIYIDHIMSNINLNDTIQSKFFVDFIKEIKKMNLTNDQIKEKINNKFLDIYKCNYTNKLMMNNINNMTLKIMSFIK